MTNILITTIGSRGDIQPFIALAKGLMSAGYTVALQTAEAYQPFVESYGVTYAYMNNEFMKLTESKAGKAATDGGGKMALLKKVMPVLRQMLDDEWTAAQAFRPDLIIYHPKALGAYHIAEKMGIPAMIALALPLYTPTSAYPIPMVAHLPFGQTFNRFSYRLIGLATAPYMGVINDFRTKSLGLPKRGRFASELIRPDGTPAPILYAYSPYVLPVPSDYPSEVHVTGYWFLDSAADWQPSQELTRFLDTGKPPVYIGFGSMSGSKAAERAEIVLAALAKTEQRGILASGWGGLKPSNLPDDVFLLDQAPHDWLFPRMAAVVHHGGAGTTAAGLRAGKPTLIVPFIADQPFWGNIIHQARLGPKPIPQGKLTLDGLAAAISTAVNDNDIRYRTELVGEKLRAENGVHTALEVIQRYV
jgi:sterol 3beta-glucosyltransferase